MTTDALAEEVEEFRPQPGPQTQCLRSQADIAIYGGAAGSAKSFGLLLEAARNAELPHFHSVIFRRETPQITNPGGLWDDSMRIFRGWAVRTVPGKLTHHFENGGTVRFSHLKEPDDVYAWQGSAVPFIGFDEIDHFLEFQFWYMMSRNRSVTGVPGYIRGTCNPDADSWVRRLIDWWIGDDGYPIEARSGVLRYFLRINDDIKWGASRLELLKRYGADKLPKSFTFIPAKLSDNKILMARDPSYLASLEALPYVERMRLLYGNWNIRPNAGTMFKAEWFDLVERGAYPVEGRRVRAWDRAATPDPRTAKGRKKANDPDWTVGVKVLKALNGRYYVEDVVRFRGTPADVQTRMGNVAKLDGHQTRIVIEQEPGASGVADVDNIIRTLAGFPIKSVKPMKDKIARSNGPSAQVEHGNVSLVNAPWTADFIHELVNFPDGRFDDSVDAFTLGLSELMPFGVRFEEDAFTTQADAGLSALPRFKPQSLIR